MMEDPGSFSGMVSSPRPQRGPDASQRISLAIFMQDDARLLRAPLAKTNSLCAESAANLFGAAKKGRPVNAAMCAAARSPNSG